MDGIIQKNGIKIWTSEGHAKIRLVHFCMALGACRKITFCVRRNMATNMNVKIRVIKRRAAYALEGHMGPAMGGMLAVSGVHLLGGLMANNLFSGTGLSDVIMGRIFVFIAALIAAVFSAGLSYLYLNIARCKDAKAGDILYFFRSQPDRVIMASFVLAVLDLVATIPYYAYIFTADPGDTAQDQIRFMMTVLILLFVSVALNVVFTAPFAMSYYLLADDERMGGGTALKKSCVMMKGSIMRYLLMELSFVPMMLLSVFTLYVALLWVLPHLYMSETVFYLKLLEIQEREEKQ